MSILSDIIKFIKNVIYIIILIVMCLIFLIQFTYIWFIKIKDSEPCEKTPKCKSVTSKINNSLWKKPQFWVIQLFLPEGNLKKLIETLKMFKITDSVELISVIYLIIIMIFARISFVNYYSSDDDTTIQNTYPTVPTTYDWKDIILIIFGIIILALPFVLNYYRNPIYNTCTNIFSKPFFLMKKFASGISEMLPKCLIENDNLKNFSYDLYIVISLFLAFLIIYVLPYVLNINQEWSKDDWHQSVYTSITWYLGIIYGITILVVNIDIFHNCIKGLIDKLKTAKSSNTSTPYKKLKG